MGTITQYPSRYRWPRHEAQQRVPGFRFPERAGQQPCPSQDSRVRWLPAHMYETWVGMGGEGNVLKDPASLYSPGERSPAWLELKPKLTLDVTVTGRSDQRIASGDWGEAVKQERSILSRYFIPSITDLPTWARSPSLSPADSQEGRRG